jgi:uncharacterized protein (TIGR02118 family)
MARMLVMYRPPKDPIAFERHYFQTHIPLAKSLPGLRKYEVSRGPLRGPSGADYYLVGTLHFDDLAAIDRAFASPEGNACAADRRIFAPDDADFLMLLFDNEAV